MTIVKLLAIQGRVHDATQNFVMPIIIVTMPMLQKLLLLGDAAGVENIKHMTLLEDPCPTLSADSNECVHSLGDHSNDLWLTFESRQ